ncbi:DUF2000 domain-containing protein [Bacillus haynesii]|uniref:DUF2000 family protein n=1 Tax=Bacillus haynesii TaxID=1925021 RepID=UPI00228308F5|nr:DUF2000 family protein [Bacillus haynesii]MCY9226305.1 DUF2000 domain-containing protein [Bacillus haynesii]
MEETKCALIIDESLPLGLIANTAAILGAALGKNKPRSDRRKCNRRLGNRPFRYRQNPNPHFKRQRRAAL